MNAKKLLKQCQQLAAQQQKSIEPPLKQKQEVKESEQQMTAAELEQYLTEFLHLAREADQRYTQAIAEEIYPNEALQDYLHVLEFAPSMLKNNFEHTAEDLTRLRALRRTTKQELEVTKLFKDWAVEYKTSLDKLSGVLGKMRKVLERQPNDLYRFKTDVIGEKGNYLVVDEKEEAIQ